jgi:hypothetical protein
VHKQNPISIHPCPTITAISLKCTPCSRGSHQGTLKAHSCSATARQQRLLARLVPYKSGSAPYTLAQHAPAHAMHFASSRAPFVLNGAIRVIRAAQQASHDTATNLPLHHQLCSSPRPGLQHLQQLIWPHDWQQQQTAGHCTLHSTTRPSTGIEPASSVTGLSVG